MRLAGECSRCGLCCRAEIEGKDYACEHLVDNSCAVYEARFDGMPIKLIADDGQTISAACGKDSAAERAAIIRLIGKGCSLRVE